jgi:hypothetical protein
MAIHRFSRAFAAGCAAMAFSVPSRSASAVADSSGSVNDGHGKEWRQLTETTGLSWDQVVQACPHDGVTPAEGPSGGRDLTGWIWATEEQVEQLFGYWAPGILDSPSLSVAGPEYLTPAAQFQSVFQLTQHLKGSPTYQESFDFRSVTGWVANSDGSVEPGDGRVMMNADGIFPTASFSIADVAPGAQTTRGVFMWRPTGLDTGGVHANDDAGQTLTPYGGATLNVLANDWIAGARPNATSVEVTQISPASTELALLSDGSVVVATGTGIGTHTLDYKISEVANPANSSEATVSITVRSFPITASNDEGFASFAAGGTPVGNVLSNDTLGGVQALSAGVRLSLVSSSHPGITLNQETGAVEVSPKTPHGTHTVTYQICERANPFNTAQATVTLLPRPIHAVNDSSRLNSKTGGSSPSVLGNDWLSGERVNPATVKLTLLSPLPKGISFNAATGVFTVAPKTESRRHTLVYRISEAASPANSDEASVTLELSGRSR